MLFRIIITRNQTFTNNKILNIRIKTILKAHLTYNIPVRCTFLRLFLFNNFVFFIFQICCILFYNPLKISIPINTIITSSIKVEIERNKLLSFFFLISISFDICLTSKADTSFKSFFLSFSSLQIFF